MTLRLVIPLIGIVSASLALAQPQSITVVSSGQNQSDSPVDTSLAHDAASGSNPLPLPPSTLGNQPLAPKKVDGDNPLISIGSSLAIVLGLFGGLLWILRKTGRIHGKGLPRDIFEVLGTSQIDHRHQTALVKCSNRVLLVALTPTGATTLCEFSDPNETSHLIAQASGRATAAFADAMAEVEKDALRGGFVDESVSMPTTPFKLSR